MEQQNPNDEETETQISQLENLAKMQQTLIDRLEVAGCSTESAKEFLACVAEQLAALGRH